MMDKNQTTKWAALRTSLAVHRTALAYFRTCISCLIGGLALVHYFNTLHPYFVHLGFFLVFLGGLNLVMGIYIVKTSLKKISLGSGS